MTPLPNPQANLPRPRQVTVAAGLGVAGSVFLVISLFDTVGSLSTPDSRASIERFLGKPPGSDLNLEVGQIIDLFRVGVLVSGALAAVALVCAIFAFQRHRGARVVFTVSAVLMLPTLPVAGAMPLVLLTAALMMWGPVARDWFAGRAPASAGPALPPVADPWLNRPADQPPSLEPSGGGTTPAEPSPPPYSQAYGQTSAPVPPTQPADPWASYGYAAAASAQSPGAPLHGAGRCPTQVILAVVLTWIGTAGAVLVMVLAMLVLAADSDQFVQAFVDAAVGTGLSPTRGQILAAGWAVTALLLGWSVVAAVLAGFLFRGAQWARIALVASAAMTAIISVLMILSIVSVVSLALSVVSIWLLFSKPSNAWFARRSHGGSPTPPIAPPPWTHPPQGPPQGPTPGPPGSSPKGPW